MEPDPYSYIIQSLFSSSTYNLFKVLKNPKKALGFHWHRPTFSMICRTRPLAAVPVLGGGAGNDVLPSVFVDTIEATKKIANAHQFQGRVRC